MDLVVWDGITGLNEEVKLKFFPTSSFDENFRVNWSISDNFQMSVDEH